MKGTINEILNVVTQENTWILDSVLYLKNVEKRKTFFARLENVLGEKIELVGSDNDILKYKKQDNSTTTTKKRKRERICSEFSVISESFSGKKTPHAELTGIIKERNKRNKPESSI